MGTGRWISVQPVYRMDSIDVYLEKKKNRMKYQMNYHAKLKVMIFFAGTLCKKSKNSF